MRGGETHTSAMSTSGDSVGGWDPSASTPRRRGTPTFRRERPSAASPSPRRASSPGAPSSPGVTLGRTSNFDSPRKSAPVFTEQTTPSSPLSRTKVLGPAGKGDGEQPERWENRFVAYKTMFLEPAADARRVQLEKEIAAQEAEVAQAAAEAEEAKEKADASRSRESSFRLRGEQTPMLH